VTVTVETRYEWRAYRNLLENFLVGEKLKGREEDNFDTRCILRRWGGLI
jgi:hypothetical protein